MAIRFRCDSCGQKLRVSDDKAGMQSKCPKCRRAITVPAESASAESEASSEESTGVKRVLAEEMTVRGPNPPSVAVMAGQLPTIRPPMADEPVLPEIVIRDDSTDWVLDSEPRSSAAETMIDYDKVAVPRRVLYLQGALLGIVALTSFVLGMLVGGRNSQRDVAALAQPCTLAGQITYGGPEASRPDSGSVVMVLPVDRRPAADSRAAVEGLRPDDPVPLDANLSLRTIRSLGGDLVRAKEDGQYQVRVPEPGRYHVLIISKRAARSGSEKVEVSDVAQLGRYIASPLELLDDRKYQWRTLTLRGNSTLDATF